MRRLRAAATAGLAAVAASAVSTAVAEPTAASHHCAAVASGPERLACYDKAFPPSPVDQAARVEQSRADFGLQVATVQQRQTAAATADVDRIEASVTAVDRPRPGSERIFTLDNGQRWQEASAASRGHVNPGDRVTVEKASFGTFLLVTPARAGLRVRRLE